MKRKIAALLTLIFLVSGFAFGIAPAEETAFAPAGETRLVAGSEQADMVSNAANQTRIKKNPKNVTARVGDVAEFTVKATGSKLKYTWEYQKNEGGEWKKVKGKTAKQATLQVKVKASMDGYIYRCKVTGKDGKEVISKTAKLTLKPLIKKQPTDQFGGIGDTVKLSISASGKKLSYQWYFRNAGVSKWKKVTGKSGTAKKVSVKLTEETNGRQYYCVVIGSNGKKEKSDIATIYASASIVQQPVSTSVKEGEKFTLSVVAKGKDLKYQWQYQLSGSTEWVDDVTETAKTPDMSMEADIEMNGRLYRCRVTDSAGNEIYSDAVTLTVERNPVSLAANPTELTASTGKSEYVFFYATLRNVEGVERVELFDADGSLIGEMLDDGQYSASGDDLPGDNIYSYRLDLSVDTAKTIKYYAQVTATEGALQSNKVKITVVDDTSGNMAQVDQTIQDTLNDANFSSLSEQERKTTAQSLLDNLVSNGQIKDSVAYEDTTGLFAFEYENGVLGGIMIKEFTDSIDGPETRQQDFSKPATQAVPGIPSPQPNVYGIGRAAIYFAFESTSYRLNFYNDTVIPDWESKGLPTSFKQNVTVTDMKKVNGNNYNVIVFAMHGSYYKNQPVFCLREVASSAKDSAYSNDLSQHRIAKVTLKDGNTYYWVFPALFNDCLKTGSLSGSFVYGQSCCSMGEGSVDSSMANAFLNKGAVSYVGNLNSIYSDYNRTFMKLFVDGLIDGKSAQEAFNTCVATYGSNDGGSPAATPMLRGDPNAYLVTGGLKNGDFEESDNPKHWIATGDVRVIQKLGGFTAPQGNNMVILTTGIGSAEQVYLSGTEGSSISQAFRMPSDKTSITFRYNVVSEEPHEWVGTPYDDTVVIELLDKQGNVLQTLAEETVNESEWTQIEGINFEGGDNTTYETGWKTITVNIAQYQGQTIVIQALATDKGDSAWDTAVMIDQFALE